MKAVDVSDSRQSQTVFQHTLGEMKSDNKLKASSKSFNQKSTTN